MQRELSYGDFRVQLIWTSSGNMIYYVFSMKVADNFQTDFTIKSPLKIPLSTPYNLHTHYSGNTMFSP